MQLDHNYALTNGDHATLLRLMMQPRVSAWLNFLRPSDPYMRR